jgi:two-component sensor histidine kinase
MLHTSLRWERPMASMIEGPYEPLANANALRHQEVLLQEMQHRVANSLQIVASILALKAKTVKSDDARLHLLDAYARVMSVAAVQRQLLDSNQPSVIRISDYLSELCQKLAKSLTDEVKLSVIADTTVTMDSNEAVAMGLIVTELVINALRHAFPKAHGGERISIAYEALGSGWRLTVSDNGVGLTDAPVNTAHPGQGSKIIDELAKKLEASIVVRSTPKGTRVSLIHSGARSEKPQMRGSLIPDRRQRNSVGLGAQRTKGAEHV